MNIATNGETHVKQFREPPLNSEINERVMVYKNLHKDCWSVKSTKTGIVLFHCYSILLKSATFKVSEKGRQRVLEKKSKNVHAGIVGNVCIINHEEYRFKERVKYNPYETKTFIKVCDKTQVTNEPFVYLSKTGQVFI